MNQHIGVDAATWGITYVILEMPEQRIVKIGEVDVTARDQTATNRLKLLSQALQNEMENYTAFRGVYIEQQPQFSSRAKQMAHWTGAWFSSKGCDVRYVRAQDKYKGQFDCFDMGRLTGESAYKRKRAARLWMEKRLPLAVEEGAVIKVNRSRMADVGDCVAIAISGYSHGQQDDVQYE